MLSINLWLFAFLLVSKNSSARQVTPSSVDSCIAEQTRIFSANDQPDHQSPASQAETLCNIQVRNFCLSNYSTPGCSKYGVNADFATVPVAVKNYIREGDGDELKGDNGGVGPKPTQLKAKAITQRAVAEQSSRDAQKKAAAPTKDSQGRVASSADATTPKPMATASTESTDDTGQCKTLATQAANRCEALSSGDQAAQKGGISDYCKQLQNAATTGSDANSNAATTCFNSYRSCSRTCGDLAQKYESLVNNCGDCESLSTYQQTAQDMRAAQSRCDKLGDKVSSMANQSSALASAAVSSDMCKDASSSSSGGSGGGGLSDSSSKMETASAHSEACATNPNGPGCGQAASQRASQDSLSATNAEAAKLSDPSTARANYDVNDPENVNSTQNFGGGAGQEASGAAGAMVKPIANNSGGGIPGGTGGAGGKSGGILGGNGGGGLFGGNSSGVADIDRGLRSGGYTSTPQTGEEKPDASAGFAGYDAGRGPASDPKGGLDLKQYLPGGALAADTLRAAAMQWRSLGIHPSHIDLWTRISEKMQLKCKLGELLDCP